MTYRTYITSWPAPRLQQVMDLRNQGYTNKQVAAELGISEGRVGSAVSAARSKYNWTPPKRKTSMLTDRERRCLALYAQGMKAPYISDTLGLTIHSVNSAIEKCIVKFGLNNRQELYLYARMQGLDHVEQEGKRMNDDLFTLKLTEEQYTELAQLWHEYMVLGPPREQMGLDRAGIALAFSQWIDSDEDDPLYGLPEIGAFFDEKERREGTAFPKERSA